jgi:ribonucleoside-diphosphate reductase alpha chain
MLNQSAPKKSGPEKKSPVNNMMAVVANQKALNVQRRFTKPGVDPLSAEAGVFWEKRNAGISDANGKVIFEQSDVEVPTTWSATATNIVVNKYFRGTPGTKERETSVKQLINRVADTMTAWGVKGKYFASNTDKEAFHDELLHLLVTQKMAFNSPVWFNVGVEKEPQCSACFINSVDDTMESILTLAKTEGMLFKFGSGTGTNFSSIRGSKELLQGGGTASGPVSFMKGFDSFAGVIKSGGKTRRAAKMVILNVDHPDILEFIRSKKKEEAKASALIAAGFDAGFNVPGGAYDSVQFQNANHSIRVTDAFMKAVENDESYPTKAVRDGKTVETLRARDVWHEMAVSAHMCGDPGVQYDTIINKYHTCKATDRIYASNPCSEYMFLNDSACNLASLNLMRFRNADGSFDVEGFMHGVAITILAQEIVIDFASYPTPKIATNSHAYRPLGLGYANLGALLMSLGLPYDSDEGRTFAATITALMGGHAYDVSAQIAAAMGPFSGYAKNKESFGDVIKMHRKNADDIDLKYLRSELWPVADAARAVWKNAEERGKKSGFKNAQVTVLAPTGTIGFMMDCDTTGIEPDIALIKYKKLVGGGLMKIVNQTVPQALEVLGYSQGDRAKMLAYLEKSETIEGAPGLKDKDLPVFDCAFRAQNGVRTIAPIAHVKMMAATQPFLSGAISKTVNMPHDATVEDIEKIYFDSWKLGLKAVAIYRDGCKQSQPLSTGKDEKVSDTASGPALPVTGYKPITLEDLIEAAKGMNAQKELGQKLGMISRRRLSAERAAITHKFSIGGHEGYFTVGLFEDGMPGELFCRMAKEGSTISGLMDVFATAISLSLQYGVPLKVLVDKFSHTRFEPSGFTGNPQIPIAKSITDYIFRWLGKRFLPDNEQMMSMTPSEIASIEPQADQNQPLDQRADYTKRLRAMQSDAPPCQNCGSIMVRNGSCYRCFNCGSTSGCS